MWQMKILLINQSNGVDFNQNPPLGTLYLASSLRKAGYNVDIYDQGAKENNLRYPSKDDIKRLSPDIVGFSLYTFGLPNTLRYIKELKESFPGIRIIIGGHHATALPERTMLDCPEADFLVFGEGEITLVELISAIESGADITKVNGLYFRDNGNIISTPPRPYTQNLDELPYPANDLIQKYTYPSENITKGKKILNLTASRGCPFSCAYCNKAVYGSTYRRRSPKNVADEIEYMINNFGYDEVMFHDELFTAKKSWMFELFDEFRKRGLKLPWRCLGRVNTVRYEDLVAMSKNGCYIIAFGLEAGNENVRIDINRRMTNAQIKETFAAAKKAGLITYAFNMINHRLDTHDTIRDTYNLMCDVNAEFAPVFICSPFPGSRLFQLLPEDIKYNWERFNSYRDLGAYPISICAISEKDLMKIADQMESFYYSRFRYLYENALISKFSLKMKKNIFRLWLGYLLVGRLKYLTGEGFLITGDKPSSRVTKAMYKIIFKLFKGFVSLFKNKPGFKPIYKKLIRG